MSTTTLYNDVPVIGGADSPCAFPDSQSIPNDDRSRHLYRLLVLHPGLVRFRMVDVASMDDQTKSLLIADISDVLGIRKPVNHA
jgi:hypothetical protein